MSITRKRRLTGLANRNGLSKHVTDGKKERRIELRYTRERRCKQLLDHFDEKRGAGILT